MSGFDRKLARLLLEICRFTYAAGIKEQNTEAADSTVPNENQADQIQSLKFLRASQALGKLQQEPLAIFGDSPTSFACVTPYENGNVVSYMGTKSEFGITQAKQLHDAVHSGEDLPDHDDLQSTMFSIMTSLKDWRRDGEAQAVSFSLDGKHLGKPSGPSKVLSGRVHKGFLRELKDVQASVISALEKCGGKDRAVILTGHSQGGAEAALATSALAAAGYQISSTYTFAAPRAGTQEFVDSVTTPVFRIEFGDDIVPHLPPSTALIRDVIQQAAQGKAVLQFVIETMFRFIGSFSYMGLGALCYGHPDEKKLHLGLSSAAETVLLQKRLGTMKHHPIHWAKHHHLVLYSDKSDDKERGNYTALVSPNGYDLA